MSCSRTQRSASGEARTRNPSISGQALYHDCAPQLGSILCRYDTCPTQYAPDLRGSILCMQGTQYAPRESILCMEHFVALQSNDTHTHQKADKNEYNEVRLLKRFCLNNGFCFMTKCAECCSSICRLNFISRVIC